MIMHECCNADAKRIFHKTNNPTESLRELPASLFRSAAHRVCVSQKQGENQMKMQGKVFFDRLLHWLLRAMMNSVMLS